MKYQQQKLPFF